MTQNQTSDTTGTLDHTRQLASQAMERAGETVRGLGSGMKDVASRGMHGFSESAHAARQQLGQYASASGRYVADHPLKSALIAAAVGALVAGAIIAMRHNRHSRG
jgi:ElaB/YqjD/DUF883 family membrane-anchored ribosome-binding protein